MIKAYPQHLFAAGIFYESDSKYLYLRFKISEL